MLVEMCVLLKGVVHTNFGFILGYVIISFNLLTELLTLNSAHSFLSFEWSS